MATSDSPSNSSEHRLHELSAENRKLKKFIDIERKVGVERNIDSLLPLIMTEISSFFKADRRTLFLLYWDRNAL